MRTRIVYHFARQTLAALLKRPGTKVVVVLLNVLVFGALAIEYGKVSERRATVAEYRRDVRARWEDSPDKHPHRMAHYGYVVFRQPELLSFFDRGVDNFVGNAVFLEAHRQNTVNFSEASLSTGLLRFGELSGALILQAILPLLLLFWGYASVAGEREDGTLRLIFAQGVRWPEVIVGRSAGLFCASLAVLLPALALTTVLVAIDPPAATLPPTLLRCGLLLLVYGAYLLAISLLTVWISAASATAKVALLRLIGLWLLFVLVVPKVAQVVGEVAYPTPSKLAFDRAVEADLREQGDSHNPDDPYFARLKDSVLAVHGVTTTEELPFNYSGFVMREGEKLSTATFLEHERDLLARYRQQRGLVRWASLLNPYLGIKYASMALAGTDDHAYRAFADQAEAYRYRLAQTMNELQMELIGNDIASSSDPRAALSRQYWLDFRDFEQRPLTLGGSLRAAGLPLLTLGCWLLVLAGLALLARRPASIL